MKTITIQHLLYVLLGAYFLIFLQTCNTNSNVKDTIKSNNSVVLKLDSLNSVLVNTKISLKEMELKMSTDKIEIISEFRGYQGIENNKVIQKSEEYNKQLRKDLQELKKKELQDKKNK